eukprot:9454154-Prorocentrum_lima.AAC.1
MRTRIQTAQSEASETLETSRPRKHASARVRLRCEDPAALRGVQSGVPCCPCRPVPAVTQIRGLCLMFSRESASQLE